MRFGAPKRVKSSSVSFSFLGEMSVEGNSGSCGGPKMAKSVAGESSRPDSDSPNVGLFLPSHANLSNQAALHIKALHNYRIRLMQVASIRPFHAHATPPPP